jgi:putative endonuclease
MGAAEKDHLAVGRRGEEQAARYLKRHGYKILERNFRVTEGEIDLVAFRDGTVAFVEVRAQTQPVLIDSLHTITRRKQRRIIKAARQYCALRKLGSEDIGLRFDVMAVVMDRAGRPVSVNHLEDAFQVSSRSL